MFAILINNSVPGSHNAWTYWVDYIMKQKDELNVKHAALVNKQGFMAANSPNFSLSCKEVSALNHAFSKKTKDRIRIQDRTYMIRSLDERHLVAFNGLKFVVICPSKTMYIIAQIEGKEKIEEATMWVRRLSSKLSLRNF
jgi:hypothetical protein